MDRYRERQNQTVLLTGFAGFIGSQILRDLLDAGYNVIGFDNLSEGSNPLNYAPLVHRFCVHIDDVATSGFVDKEVDYVIHCAAQSHVDRSWDQYQKFIDSNIKGSINLAKWAVSKGVKKFVYINTDEVFAGSAQPFTEDTIFAPENIYASTKASADFCLNNFHKAYGLPLVITHAANAYGPRQQEKIIPKSIKCLMDGVPIPLYRTQARRMWLHCADFSSGVLLAMEKGKVGERYCLAPSEENELYTHELVAQLCFLMEKDVSKFIKLVDDRPNYDLRYYMRNDKAVKELGWVPCRNIREELPGLVREYVKLFSNLE